MTCDVVRLLSIRELNEQENAELTRDNIEGVYSTGDGGGLSALMTDGSLFLLPCVVHIRA